MGGNPEIKILMRTTEPANKNKKEKPDYINNLNCVKNIRETSKGQAELIIFGDRVSEQGQEMLKTMCDEFVEVTQHGNAESCREAWNYAMQYDPETIVYFLEDDYLHRPGWIPVMLEGFERVDYVSMYDHPDKYDGRQTRMFVTESTHWKIPISTTMTFATTVEVMSEDLEMWKKYAQSGTPTAHYAFIELNKQGRTLGTPIPGYSTHGEKRWLSPLINWGKYV